MDQNTHNPSDFNRRVIDVLRTIKKRKLQADQLGLPIPKHKCWERATASDGPVSIFYGNRKTKDRSINDDVSEPESMKDSNSFAEDSDSSTSVYSEVKMEVVAAEFAKPNDGASSSSDESNMMIKTVCSEEAIMDPQALLSLQEQLLEFESHSGFIENGDESLDQCTDKELEDLLFTNGANVYVLSSGRWSVNQEAQSGNRKPTIDQEFEQYFSMLML